MSNSDTDSSSPVATKVKPGFPAYKSEFLGTASIPRMAIVYLLLDRLKLNPDNPRVHSRKQIRQIARSIKKFGFLIPILIDAEGNIIAGHGRYLASLELGLTEVPAICVEHLNEAQIKALMLADNKLTENAEWDRTLLARHLQELSELDLDFSIDITGFEFDEIDLLIAELPTSVEGNVDDEVPAIPEGPAISQIGDIWLLGKHRVLCGDATNLMEMRRLMNGKRADMAATDPPYGVDYGNTAKDRQRGTHRPILNDNLGTGFGDFLFAACSNILSVTDGAVYIFMSSSALHLLQKAFIEAGGHWSTFIIWAKNTFTLGRADYQRQYEPILYGWREGAERHWCGARDQGDVWFFDKPVRNDIHPTMKPVELMMRTIRNSSPQGGIVLDPFLGSGTTLIATERAGRVCYGMELAPLYVDAAVRRWQRHTGESAIHGITGRRFDDHAAKTEACHG